MDVGEMQTKLSRWAAEDPEKRFTDLYSLLCNEVWLRVAHDSVNSNAGTRNSRARRRNDEQFQWGLDGNLERLRVSTQGQNL